ncbi:MAG: flagellar motor switch protein FliM [Deltaproteobacteria bacterium]|jgi:flagellar motor switch protein FliM|nr:flagellar motor switch protein FliM [Deltaproteobacteria bacterium]
MELSPDIALDKAQSPDIALDKAQSPDIALDKAQSPDIALDKARSPVMTQAEVNLFLKLMKEGNVFDTEPEPEPEQEERGHLTGAVPYDLASQERIVRGRMPTLEIICERFARLFRQSMSASLGKAADVFPSSIDTVKFSQFMRTLPVPASLHVFRADPLRGSAVMVMDSKLAFGLIDSFYGGTGRGQAKIEGRDFTPLESRRIRNVIGMALADLERAWSPVHPLSFGYVRGETNPQFVSVVAPTEEVIVCGFHVELEHARGNVTVCLPYSTVEPIRSKLYAGFQSDQLELDAAWMGRLAERVREAEVTLTVELGRSRITAEELLNLSPGDCIRLNREAREPLEARVEGVPKFRVSIGSSRGQTAVRIVNDILPGPWEN